MAIRTEGDAPNASVQASLLHSPAFGLVCALSRPAVHTDAVCQIEPPQGYHPAGCPAGVVWPRQMHSSLPALVPIVLVGDPFVKIVVPYSASSSAPVHRLLTLLNSVPGIPGYVLYPGSLRPD